MRKRGGARRTGIKGGGGRRKGRRRRTGRRTKAGQTERKDRRAEIIYRGVQLIAQDSGAGKWPMTASPSPGSPSPPAAILATMVTQRVHVTVKRVSFSGAPPPYPYRSRDLAPGLVHLLCAAVGDEADDEPTLTLGGDSGWGQRRARGRQGHHPRSRPSFFEALRLPS